MTAPPGDPGDPMTADELMAATGISAERLAELPGGLELLTGTPPELSELADLLREHDPEDE
jgi:hypothetical protein